MEFSLFISFKERLACLSLMLGVKEKTNEIEYLAGHKSFVASGTKR